MGFIKTVEANCRDCYKCVRSCPVKAIRVIGNHAEIDDDRCVLCGRCVPICPQNARSVYNQIELVQKMLNDSSGIIISLAPCFPAALENYEAKQLVSALKKAGVKRVIETAEAADALLKNNHKVVAEKPVISSYCPAVVDLIEKYYPHLKQHLAPLASPLVAHGRYLRRVYPDDHLVFILPCDAKKAEALSEPEIDAVLTFEELKTILDSQLIKSKADDPIFPEGQSSFYGRTVGLSGSLKAAMGYPDHLDPRSEAISGFEECIEFLENMQAGRIGKEIEFVELLLCRGGCLNGSGLTNALTHEEKREKILAYVNSRESADNIIDLIDTDIQKEFAGKPVITPKPTEKEIREILASLGKRSKSDELDCGSCGYDTCREKAIAVYRGFAELEMCIPYMRARAESMANVIIQATPNGIIVVDEDMKIITINPAAERMFQCREEALKGREVGALLTADIFEDVLEQKRLIVDNVEYPSYGLKVRQFVFYVPKSQVVIAIFADITEQSRQKDQLSELRKETLERAQEVINKQMRVAQEIASLLGETTAETKVILDQLMRIIRG